MTTAIGSTDMTTAIEVKQLDTIADWMTAVTPTTLPDILKGVFFMDGNPLPDHCITFYNLAWDAVNRTISIPVTAPLQWTFHNTLPGWILLQGARLSSFTYKIQFKDDSLEWAQITPYTFGIPVPRWVVDTTLFRDPGTNGDIWYRKNVWFGGVPRVGEYVLRRVVDRDGHYTPAHQQMLEKVNPECLVVVKSN
ncbi:MAG: hypothetical protein NW224_14690 [Leptolyngbyaceae cyanobacterium bins.302]|nr:hypothetical protein [Leptolyngbyaceae cyanobacterium bins.302]